MIELDCTSQSRDSGPQRCSHFSRSEPTMHDYCAFALTRAGRLSILAAKRCHDEFLFAALRSLFPLAAVLLPRVLSRGGPGSEVHRHRDPCRNGTCRSYETKG